MIAHLAHRAAVVGLMRFILQSLSSDTSYPHKWPLSRRMRRSLGLALVSALALTAASCGNDNTSTTPSTPAPAPGTTTFTATLAPGGTVMHTFTASAVGAATVTLMA